MRYATDAERCFYQNPLPLSDEIYWTAAQLRVVKRLIQLEYNANPLFASNPKYYIGRMAQSLTFLPHMGMYQFWLQALAINDNTYTVSRNISDMYISACMGKTFRHVAYPAYKANRRAR